MAQALSPPTRQRKVSFSSSLLSQSESAKTERPTTTGSSSSSLESSKGQSSTSEARSTPSTTRAGNKLVTRLSATGSFFTAPGDSKLNSFARESTSLQSQSHTEEDVADLDANDMFDDVFASSTPSPALTDRTGPKESFVSSQKELTVSQVLCATSYP